MSGERKFRAALAWSYLKDVGDRVTSVIVSFVLAALLGPTIFGTMALALVFVFFLELIVTQGLLAALIQRRDLTDEHLDTAFLLVMVLSVFGFFASAVLLGRWWAGVNDVPELAVILPVLSLYLPLKGLLLVQEAVFRRNLDFKTLAIRVNLSSIACGIFGIGLALAGAGIWALVAQQLVTVTVDVIVLWVVSPWRPRLRWSSTRARQLMTFSGPNFVAAMGLFASERGDAVVIGSFFGPSAVGLYRFASRFVDMLLDTSLAALQSVSLPGLAVVQSDEESFVSRARGIFRVAALTVPLLGVLAGIAEPLCALAGEEWADAAPVLQILCVAGVFRIVFVLAIPLLQARGRPGMLALLTWTSGVLTLALLALAGYRAGSDLSVRDQLTALASSRALAAVVVSIVAVYLLRRVARVPTGAIVHAFPGPVLAGLVAVLVELALVDVVGESRPLVATLLIGSVGAMAAGGALLMASPWLRHEVAEVLDRVLQRSPKGLGPADVEAPVGGRHP